MFREMRRKGQALTHEECLRILNERESGVLALSAKTKLRLLPALNIPMELLAEAMDVIVAALK